MIKLVRCDDRLIHGQCMNMIVKQYDVKKIIVIDDINASNPILRRIFERAVPDTMTVQLVSEDEAKQAITENMQDTDNSIVLMRSPVTAVRLFKENEALEKDLNIANVNAKEHVYTVTRYAYLDDDGIIALKNLDVMGVHIWFNQIPGKPILEWNELKKDYE